MFKFPWPGCITRASKMAAVEAENARLKVLLRAYRCIADVRQAIIAELEAQNEELRKMPDQDWR